MVYNLGPRYVGSLHKLDYQVSWIAMYGGLPGMLDHDACWITRYVGVEQLSDMYTFKSTIPQHLCNSCHDTICKSWRSPASISVQHLPSLVQVLLLTTSFTVFLVATDVGCCGYIVFVGIFSELKLHKL